MLQPYHLLYLFPLLAAIKREKLDPNGIAFFPGNNVGYFGPLAETLRYGADQGYAWAGCEAGVSSLGIEADGSMKGCPSLPTSDYVSAATFAIVRLRDISLGTQARKSPSAGRAVGLLQDLPSRARCRGRLHLDVARAVRPPWQQSLVPFPGACVGRSRPC